MRMLLVLPLLMAAACSVENDEANDQLRVEYNEQKIEGAAAEVGNAAEEIASSVGNVAASAGEAVKNEVGNIDVDVDVDVNRNRDEPANTQ